MIDETPRLEAVIFKTIYRLSSNLSRKYDQLLLERYGIGFSQYRILQLIHDSPSNSQRTISKYLGTTEASVSRQVQIMIGMGLIERVVNQANKRENLVRISRKGARFVDDMDNALYQRMSKLLAEIKLSKLKQLNSTLDAISAELDNLP